MDQAHPRQPRREIELDFLRGIAILLVVEYHSRFSQLTRLSAWLRIDPVGALGVPIFFVLSGFLVGGLLIKEWKVRKHVDGGRFLIRRGFKVWPQYYLFLLVNVIAGHRTIRDLWPSFLNIQNYFPGGIAHLWSLAIEEHAYILLTLFLVIAARIQSRLRSVFVLLAVLAVASSALRLFAVLHGYPYFTPTHTRIGGIFYGVMIAIVFHSAPQSFRRLQDQRWLWVGLLAAAFAFLRFNDHHSWTVSVSADMYDLISICTLMLLYRHTPNGTRSWPYRLVAWIGLYSYGIYLWHVSVFAPVERLTAGLPRHVGDVAAALGAPLCGILLGAAMTRLVEFPALRLRDRWFPRRISSAVEDTPAEASALAG